MLNFNCVDADKFHVSSKIKNADKSFSEMNLEVSLFIKQASDRIHIINIDAIIVEASYAFCKSIGYSYEEVIGKSLAEIDVYISDNTISKKIISDAYINAGVQNFKTQHICKDSTKINVSVQTSKIVIGEVTYLYATSRAINEMQNSDKEMTLTDMHFTKAFESAPHGIGILNADGSWISANKSLCDLFGYTKEELLKINFQSLTHPDDLENGLLNHRQILNNEKDTFQIEKRYIHKNGDIIWTHLSVSCIRDLNGKVINLVSQIQDITEQKMIEHNLIENEIKFRSLFEFSPNPQIIFDRSGIIDCNTATVHILRCDDKLKILSRQLSSFSPEFQPDGARSINKAKEIDKLANKRGECRFEWTHRTFDGLDFDVEVTLTQLYLERKKVFLAMWRDLTEIKKNNAKMIQSSKMASLGEMAGGVAHEINNPLAIINGKASQIKRNLLRDNYEKEKVINDLEKIEKTVERIAKIIKGLRTFSRNSEKDPMEQASIGQIIEDTFELCKERFKIHSIEVRIKNQFNDFIKCRPAQISQILMNLLMNAFDAVENQNEKWIEIQVLVHCTQIKIAVKDSGQKIPQHVLEKMMEPFFTTKEIGKGTGLGLSISKSIAQDHNGSLYYDHSANHTCFVLELPLSN